MKSNLLSHNLQNPYVIDNAYCWNKWKSEGKNVNMKQI